MENFIVKYVILQVSCLMMFEIQSCLIVKNDINIREVDEVFMIFVIVMLIIKKLKGNFCFDFLLLYII